MNKSEYINLDTNKVSFQKEEKDTDKYKFYQILKEYKLVNQDRKGLSYVYEQQKLSRVKEALEVFEQIIQKRSFDFQSKEVCETLENQKYKVEKLDFINTSELTYHLHGVTFDEVEAMYNNLDILKVFTDENAVTEDKESVKWTRRGVIVAVIVGAITIIIGILQIK